MKMGEEDNGVNGTMELQRVIGLVEESEWGVVGNENPDFIWK